MTAPGTPSRWPGTLSAFEVDGYRVWYADTNPGNWEIVAQVEGTATQHIATRTGYYCVDAIKALDSSEEQSNKADNRAEMYLVDDTMSVYGNSGIQSSKPTPPLATPPRNPSPRTFT